MFISVIFIEPLYPAQSKGESYPGMAVSQGRVIRILESAIYPILHKYPSSQTLVITVIPREDKAYQPFHTHGMLNYVPSMDFSSVSTIVSPVPLITG